LEHSHATQAISVPSKAQLLVNHAPRALSPIAKAVEPVSRAHSTRTQIPPAMKGAPSASRELQPTGWEGILQTRARPFPVQSITSTLTIWDILAEKCFFWASVSKTKRSLMRLPIAGKIRSEMAFAIEARGIPSNVRGMVETAVPILVPFPKTLMSRFQVRFNSIAIMGRWNAATHPLQAHLLEHARIISVTEAVKLA